MLTLLSAGILEDLKDLGYQRLALLGWEIPGVDGLFIGLKVAELTLLGQVPVYETHNGVNLLAR